MGYQDNEKGIRAAQAVAEWELGDSSWAWVILSAYFNPELTMELLAEEKNQD